MLHTGSEGFYLYPGDQIKPIAINEVLTLGDLHGNTLYFIQLLVLNGVLGCSVETYDKMVRCYETYYKNIHIEGNKTLAYQAILDFITIFKHECQVLQPHITLILIGDIVCDRGPCDYATLQLLKMLIDSGVSIECILSNHDIGLIDAFYGEEICRGRTQALTRPVQPGQYAKKIMDPRQSRSLDNMLAMIENGMIQREELKSLIETYYLPNLNLYVALPESQQCDSPKSIALFVHGSVVALEVIYSLAEKFAITIPQTHTPKQLLQVMLEINERWKVEYRDTRRFFFTEELAELYACAQWDGYQETSRDMDKSIDPALPICRLIFNRGLKNMVLSDDLVLPDQLRCIKIPKSVSLARNSLKQQHWQADSVDPGLLRTLSAWQNVKIRVFHGHDGILVKDDDGQLTYAGPENDGELQQHFESDPTLSLPPSEFVSFSNTDASDVGKRQPRNARDKSYAGDIYTLTLPAAFSPKLDAGIQHRRKLFDKYSAAKVRAVYVNMIFNLLKASWDDEHMQPSEDFLGCAYDKFSKRLQELEDNFTAWYEKNFIQQKPVYYVDSFQPCDAAHEDSLPASLYILKQALNQIKYTFGLNKKMLFQYMLEQMPALRRLIKPFVSPTRTADLLLYATLPVAKQQKMMNVFIEQLQALAQSMALAMRERENFLQKYDELSMLPVAMVSDFEDEQLPLAILSQELWPYLVYDHTIEPVRAVLCRLQTIKAYQIVAEAVYVNNIFPQGLLQAESEANELALPRLQRAVLLKKAEILSAYVEKCLAHKECSQHQLKQTMHEVCDALLQIKGDVDMEVEQTIKKLWKLVDAVDEDFFASLLPLQQQAVMSYCSLFKPSVPCAIKYYNDLMGLQNKIKAQHDQLFRFAKKHRADRDSFVPGTEEYRQAQEQMMEFERESYRLSCLPENEFCNQEYTQLQSYCKRAVDAVNGKGVGADRVGFYGNKQPVADAQPFASAVDDFDQWEVFEGDHITPTN